MQKTYFWHKKEDSWAILIGLGIVAAATILFLADAENVLHLFNMKVSGWSSAADLGPVLTKIALPAFEHFYISSGHSDHRRRTSALAFCRKNF